MNDYYFGITDPGRVRDNNEDAFLVEQVNGGRILAAVIDGVGGYEGGEVAAAIAKDCIAELRGAALNDVGAALPATLIEINKRIVEARMSQAGKESMACVLTLAIADTAANEFYYAHVGDTRLYLHRGQSLVKVSKDHSFVGFLEESNRITEQDAMRHPKRNEVDKVLGADPDIGSQPGFIDAGSSPFLPGDTLLLCSDGLTDMIGGREIADVLIGQDSIPAKAKALVDAANRAGGNDNITVVLIQHPRAPASHEPTMPAARNQPADQPSQTAAKAALPGQRRGNPLVWLLSFACLALAGGLAWLYTHQQQRDPIAAAPVPAAVPTLRNAAEQRLQDSLYAATGSLAIDTAAFASPLLVSDALVIDKDTFRLNGNGMVLRCDSGMRGSGLVLSPNARHVVLENIVLENFPIAIFANNNALELRNVRFRNCAIPMSYAFAFPDMQPVRGAIQPAAIFRTDTSADNR